MGNVRVPNLRHTNHLSEAPLPSTQVGGTLAQPVDSPEETVAGRINVPGYEVLGELGPGGMGVVLKARQSSINRIVALKMIRSGVYATSDQLKRFFAEASAVARLQHPNIVQLFDCSQCQGVPFFSMEYVEGHNLEDSLSTCPSPQEAARAVVALAKAMDYAHACGIIHRDLKPANVLVSSRDGTLKITDFGLAKQAGSDLTATGEIMGTPSYMAPEQAAGQNHLVSARTDVYALGAILYYLLTHRPPFRKDSIYQTTQAVINDSPIPQSQIRVGIPKDLETICLKSLRKDTTERYTSCAELAVDLERFLAGELISARRYTLLDVVRRRLSRVEVLSGLVAGIGAIGMIVSFLLMIHPLGSTEFTSGVVGFIGGSVLLGSGVLALAIVTGRRRLASDTNLGNRYSASP